MGYIKFIHNVRTVSVNKETPQKYEEKLLDNRSSRWDRTGVHQADAGGGREGRHDGYQC